MSIHLYFSSFNNITRRYAQNFLYFFVLAENFPTVHISLISGRAEAFICHVNVLVRTFIVLLWPFPITAFSLRSSNKRLKRSLLPRNGEENNDQL